MCSIFNDPTTFGTSPRQGTTDNKSSPWPHLSKALFWVSAREG